MHGLSSGYCALHMDQGKILWPSQSISKITMQAVYHLEPTGSDATSENGKVEHLDGIFAWMLQSLLHGAGLPAQFFSATLVHNVYLKSITGIMPWAAHLVKHGLQMSQMSLILDSLMQSTCKVWHLNCSLGIAGFWCHSKACCYHDLTSHCVELSTYYSIHEAHYGASPRPAGPEVMMDMGYELTAEKLKRLVKSPSNLS